jgi:hypothetical protein
MKNEEEFEPKGSVIPYWNYCSSQNSIDWMNLYQAYSYKCIEVPISRVAFGMLAGTAMSADCNQLITDCARLAVTWHASWHCHVSRL